MQFVKPMPFTEAVEKLGDKTPIGSALKSSQWREVPVALRERAMFSATIENARFLQRAKDTLGDFLTGAREQLPFGEVALKAGSRADFVKQMQDFAIAEGMGPLDPKEAGTLKDIRSQRRLELIFDTQIRQAQDYGNWKQGMDPDLLDQWPAQRFIRVVDVVKPRPLHQQNEGVVRLKTDLDFWIGMNVDFHLPYGPWGYNSGMDVEDVSRDEAEQLGLIKPSQKVRPADRELNDRLQASIRGLDPELLDTMGQAFGDDQVEIDEDQGAIRWAKKRKGGAS